MAKGKKGPRRSLNLYWVETDDHAEDWFVVAGSERQAATYHETAEGYLVGDAVARLVARVPAGIGAERGWPSDEVLEACGGKLLHEETPRVVELAGHRFTEGMLEAELRRLDDDRFEALGEGRPNRTKRPPRA